MEHIDSPCFELLRPNEGRPEPTPMRLLCLRDRRHCAPEPSEEALAQRAIFRGTLEHIRVEFRAEDEYNPHYSPEMLVCVWAAKGISW